jgi:hypothetical protein
MKTTIVSFAMFCLSLSTFASTLEVTCTSGEDKLVITANMEQYLEPQILSIYNQNGSGPNNLEASFVGSKGFFQISPSDTLFVSSEFPMGGKVQVEFLDMNGGTGAGTIVYPGEDKSVLALKECSFKFLSPTKN